MKSSKRQNRPELPQLYPQPAWPPTSVPPATLVARGEIDQDPNLPAGSARWVAVAGVGHDAGTTTVAALLSAAYASHRRYRIVTVDAHPLGGALGARLATRGAATVADLAAAAPDLASFNLLAPYLDQTIEGAWAVTGSASAAPAVSECREALGALSGFFAVGVVDCGPVGRPVADALLESAHAGLLVAPVSVEGVLAAASALDWIAARRETGAQWHCGVALVSTTRNPNTDVGWAARLLTGRGGRVVPVPYDSGLVAGRISPASVSDGVWGAARRLATEMLSRAARSGHNG